MRRRLLLQQTTWKGGGGWTLVPTREICCTSPTSKCCFVVVVIWQLLWTRSEVFSERVGGELCRSQRVMVPTESERASSSSRWTRIYGENRNGSWTLWQILICILPNWIVARSLACNELNAPGMWRRCKLKKLHWQRFDLNQEVLSKCQSLPLGDFKHWDKILICSCVASCWKSQQRLLKI